MNWERARQRDRVRQVPPDRQPTRRIVRARPQQCRAIKANGKRCGGMAMHGQVVCGPHLDYPPARILN